MAGSSKQAQHLDEAQYRFDDGPCLRAAREETVFYIQDTSDDERFGNYLAPVATHGIRSILAIPIPLAGTELFAREASKSLRLAVKIAALAESNANLKAARLAYHDRPGRGHHYGTEQVTREAATTHFED